MSSTDTITVLGAREHNLQGVDLHIPRDSLVVFTGLSGSGKSSLAFDTIYQEGQRRFMESLSAYARQFLGKMEKPKVDHVEGLSPTISIDQKTVNRNPRSTVGTVTEILDHLRLLMSRLGTAHCPACGTAITALAPGQIADNMLEAAAGGRVMVLAPIVRDRKGEYRKELDELRQAGWVRARIDGEVRRLDEEIPLARYEKHTLEVVLDRLSATEESRMRLIEAIERSLRMAANTVSALIERPGQPDEHRTWSSDRACPKHPEISIPELEPRLFSFNAPQGACPTCKGLGALEDFEPDRLVEPEAKLPEALLVFNEEGRIPFSSVSHDVIRALAKSLGGDLRKPWRAQPEALRAAVMLGEGNPWSYQTKLEQGDRTIERTRTWMGILPIVREVWHYTKYKGFERFRSHQSCPSCHGARLNPVAMSVRFAGKGVSELSAMTVSDALEFFGAVRLRGNEKLVGDELLREIRARLIFLHQVGLGYLAMDRSSATLSGGEAQRIRLAAQVGSGLQGVTYVLDEPSIGLHPRDNQRLLATLHRLRDQGNSVLVVEHDRETMEAADYVVDVGPGAGVEGGRVVAQGPPASLLGADSPTARVLRGEDRLEMPTKRRPGSGKSLRVVGARANNLRDVSVEVPLGKMVAVTGVSGSGKSSLIVQVLQPALTLALRKDEDAPAPGEHDRVEGTEHVDKLIVIDQSPIGRTPRSNPATYTGAMDPIRELFAALPESRARGYKPGRFSFNIAGGRCEECQGAGVQTIEMQFLADVQVVCESCGGRRFNNETLEIRYRGKTITDILEMSIGDGALFFANHVKIRRILDTLVSVGMGYVNLGQPSTTLSGGEAQRIKLATELHRPSTGHTLYLLDEPTTGLHFADVRRLLDALNRLVDAGNTVVVIEHDMDVVKMADHVIDLGPEGGKAGGLIVGEGPPEAIARLDTPTGRVLAQMPDFGGPPHSFKPVPRASTRNVGGDLIVRGARCHNLRGVDITIPRSSLAVITGVSGSGKTSLAFDTIFAEGQRRYVECMSTYARRFLGRMDRAPVESVEGLAPAIAIDQKSASHNPRSTVATVTEDYDYLRLLWARIGEPHCPICDVPIRGYSPSAGARLLAEEAGGKGWMLAPLAPAHDGEERRRELLREGFVRLLKLEGEAPAEVDLESPASAALLSRGALLVMDRLDPRTDSRQRVAESLRGAYGYANGEAVFYARDGLLLTLNERPECPTHGAVLPADLSPRSFSFNSYVGACTGCEGTGMRTALDPALIFPERHKPLYEAMDGRAAAVLKRSDKTDGRLRALAAHIGADVDAPLERWSATQMGQLLDGLPGVTLQAQWKRQWGSSKSKVTEDFEWTGLRPLMDAWNSDLSWLRREQVCTVCKGGRLKPEILAIRVGGLSISQLCAKTVVDALAFWEDIQLDENDRHVADQPLHEVRGRLRFLRDVGLAYLSLDRSAGTLSGGESQRIRLASQLGSGLTGCIYVLDEPTVGLHPRDTRRLLDALIGLRDLGNTVVVVEHDRETMRSADFIADMGPGAGEHGGLLVASGSPAEVEANPSSLTGAYLSGRTPMPRPSALRKAKGEIVLEKPRINNLRVDRASFPVGVLTAVTGVSGSGKSSLVVDALVPALQRHLGATDQAVPCASVKIPDGFNRLVLVDQAPIGTTPRSTPATYVKVLDPLRELFAATNLAKERGYGPGRFSFNSAEGRCPTCEGRGQILVEMHFLSDVWVDCELCRGRRFDDATLEVRWQGLNIADALDLRAEDALTFFRNHRRIYRPLKQLVDVGLGYLRLGQAATTLSGGEAQRVKLARELGGNTEGTVFVLDEPTTGLHFADVEKLIYVLHRLVDGGATVVVIEHNTDLILNADHVIDLGPDGGSGGGLILATGTPASLAKRGTPTGLALAAEQAA